MLLSSQCLNIVPKGTETTRKHSFSVLLRHPHPRFVVRFVEAGPSSHEGGGARPHVEAVGREDGGEALPVRRLRHPWGRGGPAGAGQGREQGQVGAPVCFGGCVSCMLRQLTAWSPQGKLGRRRPWHPIQPGTGVFLLVVVPVPVPVLDVCVTLSLLPPPAPA